MGLNDQAEKLRQAWEWLENAPFDSEHYQAAYEYIDEEVIKNFDQIAYRRLIDTDRQRWIVWYMDLAGGLPSDLDDNCPL